MQMNLQLAKFTLLLPKQDNSKITTRAQKQTEEKKIESAQQKAAACVTGERPNPVHVYHTKHRKRFLHSQPQLQKTKPKSLLILL